MNGIQQIWLSIVIWCCAGMMAYDRAAVAQETDFLDQELTPELIEQYELKLNAILKTRTDQEKLFIAQLVDNMQQGTVPIKLVSTAQQLPVHLFRKGPAAAS